MPITEDDILECELRARVLTLDGKFFLCTDCVSSIDIDYRVNASLQGWVIKCSNCGVIKEYDN